MVSEKELSQLPIELIDINALFIQIKEEFTLIAVDNFVETELSKGVFHTLLDEIWGSTEMGVLFIGRCFDPNHNLVFLDVFSQQLALSLYLALLFKEFF